MLGDQLLMQLTLEQGPGRETQVQPTLGAWRQYFRFDPPAVRRLPSLTFQRLGRRRVERRPVVGHDHNWTIELDGAAVPKPAILRIDRVGKRRYRYWVYRPDDAEYDHCQWILANFLNPHQRKGRKWIII